MKSHCRSILVTLQNLKKPFRSRITGKERIGKVMNDLYYSKKKCTETMARKERFDVLTITGS